jgi:hypothetical protein
MAPVSYHHCLTMKPALSTASWEAFPMRQDVRAKNCDRNDPAVPIGQQMVLAIELCSVPATMVYISRLFFSPREIW